MEMINIVSFLNRSAASSLNISVSIEVSACFARVSIGCSSGAAIWSASAQDAHSADGIVIVEAQNIIVFVGTWAVVDGRTAAARSSSHRACNENEENGKDRLGHDVI